jgi:hypoxanthine phosphoribosyltransferase
MKLSTRGVPVTMNHPKGAYAPYLAEILLSEDEIIRRVGELGRELTRFYAASPNLLLVCVLKGGFIFLSDLTRHLDVPHAIDFMAITSYGAGVRKSSGHVRILMDLEQDIAGRDVLIVEDIIDSGHTLNYILSQLQARTPASLRVCCLLSKPARREVDIKVDFLGFEIPDKFVFGYGLDLDEKFRNLPFIGVAKT